MFAMCCQKWTHASQQKGSLFDQLAGAQQHRRCQFAIPILSACRDVVVASGSQVFGNSSDNPNSKPGVFQPG
jgi:hypothetical protein